MHVALFICSSGFREMTFQFIDADLSGATRSHKKNVISNKRANMVDRVSSETEK